ncbi:hypothetical protein Hanom_Chr04g00356591 [Helianthus anomalus]
MAVLYGNMKSSLSFLCWKRRLPAGKGTRGKRRETDGRFAQSGKKDGVKCSHGWLLADSLTYLDVLTPGCCNPDRCATIFDLLSAVEADSVSQILTRLRLYLSTPPKTLFRIRNDKKTESCQQDNLRNLWYFLSNERQDLSCSR